MDPVAALLSIPGVGPYIPYLLFASAVATALVNFLLPKPVAGGSAVYAALYAAVHLLSDYKTPPAPSAKP